MVTVVLRVAPVADNVHSADHFADGEESDNLRNGDTGQSELLLVGVADASDDILRGDEVGVLEGGGVAESIDQRLEVRLEGNQVPKNEVLAKESRLVLAMAGNAYGGVMFCPRNTSLPSSSPTRA